MGSFFCDLQQIFKISNARWNSSAILAPLAFMVMPKTGIKFHKVYSLLTHGLIIGLVSTIFSSMRILINSEWIPKRSQISGVDLHGGGAL